MSNSTGIDRLISTVREALHRFTSYTGKENAGVFVSVSTELFALIKTGPGDDDQWSYDTARSHLRIAGYDRGIPLSLIPPSEERQPEFAVAVAGVAVYVYETVSS